MAIIKIGNPAIDLDAAEIPNLSANKITSDTNFPKDENVSTLVFLYSNFHKINGHFIDGSFDDGLVLIPEIEIELHQLHLHSFFSLIDLCNVLQ